MAARFKLPVSFDQLLIVWLTAVSLVAWYWPQWFGSLSDPFLGTAKYLDYLFAVTMFAIGWMLPRDEIEQVRRRWPMVLAGTTLQYTSMPFLAWSMGLLLGLDEDARLGLLLVGCVPDAMASGVLTLAARGNVSYAVSLTTASTLLSPLPSASLLAALLLVNVLGYAAGYFGGRLLRLPEPMTRALTLVVGMQNAGLGALIATSAFKDRPAVQIPSAVFALLSVYTGMLLVLTWTQWDAWRKAPRGE